MTIARDDLEVGPGADHGSSRLLGREAERARLAQLLTDVAAGHSSALRLYGQSGIGKSALLDDVAGRGGALRVLRLRGLATERDLPYAGLHQLCAPFARELHRLEPRQLAALDAALGQAAEQPPDRFLVSLAVLNLLDQLAAVRPVCCIVDDAHLLDVASLLVLAFVARRTEGGARLILFAEDERRRRAELEGLPELQLGPIPSDDARTALAAAAPHGIDPAVIERVLLETRGNARALADAFADITDAELAGGFAVLVPRSEDRGEDHRDARRVPRLPEAARRLLLVAASEPTGNPTIVWDAAGRLEIDIEAVEALESEGLLTFGPRVLFRYPRLRSTVYAAAAQAERRSVHRALAEATTGAADADRRTWHRALSTAGFDERIAGDLERRAAAAQVRGGAAARAAFLEQAALLSAHPESRGERALAAAVAKQLVGGTDAAMRLLAIAEIAAPDEPREARITLQRARIAFTARRDSTAPGLLQEAAERLEPHWPVLARQAHLEALVASMATGRLGATPTMAEAARTARAVAHQESDRPVDLLLQALATRVLDGYTAAVRPLRKAVHAFSRGADPTAEDWRWLAGFVAADLWDERAWNGLSGECAGTGADFQRPDHVLAQAALAELCRGHFEHAQATLADADAHTQAADVAPVLSPSVLLPAWQGDAAVLRDRLPFARRSARHRGDDRGLAAVSLAEAVLHNGLGHYEKAAVAVRHAVESDQLVLAGWALPELVEAATRSGQREEAAAALARLRDRATAADTDWGLGVYAASAALLAEDSAAEELYREAVDRLSRTGMRVQRGRAQLVYGEWLRRQNRRADAREVLRDAMDLFAGIGAEAFADRARSELLATSERARARRPGTARTLTPQEYRIAYLACGGLTNPEIGAELFISPRTVEYHLGNVFGKLAITSRTELHLVLDRTESPWREVRPRAARLR